MKKCYSQHVFGDDGLQLKGPDHLVGVPTTRSLADGFGGQSFVVEESSPNLRCNSNWDASPDESFDNTFTAKPMNTIQAVVTAAIALP